MKILTFNIRCDFGQDGKNNFVNRKEHIKAKLLQEKPDIIGFQEVLPHVALWLKENLPDYHFIGCGRSKELSDEQTTVGFRKEKFELMKMETHWLSPTPDVPGSRYADQSSCPRTFTEAVLKPVDSSRPLRIINTHLDHEGVGARLEGLSQIFNWVRDNRFMPDVPTFITGDFNFQPTDEEMGLIREHKEFTNLTEDAGITYHDFGNKEHEVRIDYILARGGVKLVKLEKWMDSFDGVYFSDHYPVCATVELV